MTGSETLFDAIVVGSGMSGGWAAKELTEAGLKVLVIERGREIEHGGPEYFAEGAGPWERDYHGRLPEAMLDKDYQIQRKCYAFYDGTSQFFVKDSDHPYSQAKDKPFDWIRGYHTGGRSHLWHRQSYRLGPDDFLSNKRDGHGVDWPIRYEDLAPWYDHVERFAGISGSQEGLYNLPDGVFQKPHDLNVVEQMAKGRIEETFPGRKLIIGRTAHLTEPTEEQMDLGRGLCQSRNECQRGCSWGGYFSSNAATLPAARNTGNLTMVHNQIVHSVIQDQASGEVTGVRVIDANTRETGTFSGRMIFLCASTLGTTQIMMMSKSERSPNGLGNRSDELGRNLMDHTYASGATGDFDGFQDDYYIGRRPTGIYIPRYVNYGDDERDFLRGYGFQGGAERAGWQRGQNMKGTGADFKAALRQPGGWSMRLSCFGEMLPHRDNRVTLHPTKRDKWGLPVLHIDCEHKDNERKLIEAGKQDAVEMLKAAGAKNVRKFGGDAPPGLGIHEMGTARMGRDPETSVLNGWNQAHEAPNLFVTDGAAMTSSACQNPSLTYMALTARASSHAIELLKENRIGGARS